RASTRRNAVRSACTMRRAEAARCRAAAVAGAASVSSGAATFIASSIAAPSRRLASASFVDVPPGEAAERLRPLFLAPGYRSRIAPVLAERAEAFENRAAPRMGQDVSRLEIAAILGLLEREVLGKRLFRVADMEPRQHDRRRARAAPAAVIGDPGDA